MDLITFFVLDDDVNLLSKSTNSIKKKHVHYKTLVTRLALK
jgi:hypothetical protein